jgi:signal transduction histidine kinase
MGRLNLGIRSRILTYYVLVALVPLITIDFVWYHSSQNQLQTSAHDRQAVLTTESAKRLNQALTDKLNSVVSHSQEASYVALDADQISTSLLRYAYQDGDVKRAAVTDQSGTEQVVVEDGKSSKPRTNVAGTDAFLAIRRVTSEPYISTVTYGDGHPYVTVSVPILSFNRLGDQQLTEAQALARRFGSDIKGAFIVTFDLQNLLQSVLANKIGTHGYVYIIDSKGELIAHPDNAFMATRPDIKKTGEVVNAQRTLDSMGFSKTVPGYHAAPSETTSERGISVLSSSYPIGATGWAIIGQEPIADVYNSAHHIFIVAMVILLLAVPSSLMLILLATRNTISPIRQLTEGAVRIGNGDFNYELHINSNDEVGTLAKTFSAMGARLKGVIGQYQTQNLHLVAEQSKLQAVLNTITDGVIVLSNDYRVVLVNNMISSLILLPDPRSIYGHPWLEAFNLTHDDKPLSNERLADAYSSFDNVVLHLGDQVRYLNLTAVKLVNDPNGIAYIITVQDITKTRELESMRLDFVSMAAHELRTPLTGVRGYLELIDKSWDDVEARQKYVQSAIASANTLGALINNILSLSRIERNVMKLNVGRLSWKEIIESEVRNHTFAANAKDIRLSAQLHDKPIAVMGDELYLREVLGNLISNAIHYTEAGGTITVSIEATYDTVKTIVADTGVGIAPESVEKLFSKYYRASGGLTTNSQGTGIGLFISKSIVDAHHGTIGVESVLGQGSRFYFILPRATDEHASDTAMPANVKKQGDKVEWF